MVKIIRGKTLERRINMRDMKEKMLKLATKKADGAEGVVVALVLIVVAVALCIVFRKNIAGLLDTAMNSTQNSVNSIFQWADDTGN